MYRYAPATYTLDIHQIGEVAPKHQQMVYMVGHGVMMYDEYKQCWRRYIDADKYRNVDERDMWHCLVTRQLLADKEFENQREQVAFIDHLEALSE